MTVFSILRSTKNFVLNFLAHPIKQGSTHIWKGLWSKDPNLTLTARVAHVAFGVLEVCVPVIAFMENPDFNVVEKKIRSYTVLQPLPKPELPTNLRHLLIKPYETEWDFSKTTVNSTENEPIPDEKSDWTNKAIAITFICLAIIGIVIPLLKQAGNQNVEDPKDIDADNALIKRQHNNQLQKNTSPNKLNAHLWDAFVNETPKKRKQKLSHKELNPPLAPVRVNDWLSDKQLEARIQRDIQSVIEQHKELETQDLKDALGPIFEPIECHYDAKEFNFYYQDLEEKVQDGELPLTVQQKVLNISLERRVEVLNESGLEVAEDEIIKSINNKQSQIQEEKQSNNQKPKRFLILESVLLLSSIGILLAEIWGKLRKTHNDDVITEDTSIETPHTESGTGEVLTSSSKTERELLENEDASIGMSHTESGNDTSDDEGDSLFSNADIKLSSTAIRHTESGKRTQLLPPIPPSISHSTSEQDSPSDIPASLTQDNSASTVPSSSNMSGSSPIRKPAGPPPPPPLPPSGKLPARKIGQSTQKKLDIVNDEPTEDPFRIRTDEELKKDQEEHLKLDGVQPPSIDAYVLPGGSASKDALTAAVGGATEIKRLNERLKELTDKGEKKDQPTIIERYLKQAEEFASIVESRRKIFLSYNEKMAPLLAEPEEKRQHEQIIQLRNGLEDLLEEWDKSYQKVKADLLSIQEQLSQIIHGKDNVLLSQNNAQQYYDRCLELTKAKISLLENGKAGKGTSVVKQTKETTPEQDLTLKIEGYLKTLETENKNIKRIEDELKKLGSPIRQTKKARRGSLLRSDRRMSDQLQGKIEEGAKEVEAKEKELVAAKGKRGSIIKNLKDTVQRFSLDFKELILSENEEKDLVTKAKFIQSKLMNNEIKVPPLISSPRLTRGGSSTALSEGTNTIGRTPGPSQLRISSAIETKSNTPLTSLSNMFDHVPTTPSVTSSLPASTSLTDSQGFTKVVLKKRNSHINLNTNPESLPPSSGLSNNGSSSSSTNSPEFTIKKRKSRTNLSNMFTQQPASPTTSSHLRKAKQPEPHQQYYIGKSKEILDANALPAKVELRKKTITRLCAEVTNLQTRKQKLGKEMNKGLSPAEMQAHNQEYGKITKDLTEKEKSLATKKTEQEQYQEALDYSKGNKEAFIQRWKDSAEQKEKASQTDYSYTEYGNGSSSPLILTAAAAIPTLNQTLIEQQQTQQTLPVVPIISDNPLADLFAKQFDMAQSKGLISNKIEDIPRQESDGTLNAWSVSPQTSHSTVHVAPDNDNGKLYTFMSTPDRERLAKNPVSETPCEPTDNSDKIKRKMERRRSSIFKLKSDEKSDENAGSPTT